jgi:hypothetical protein
MFDIPVREIRRVFVDPCQTCEHMRGCEECPNAPREKARKIAFYEMEDGRIHIGSGEDAYIYA